MDKMDIYICVIIIWSIITVIQQFLAYGTAYRCTKKGNDNGTGLFLYLLGFSLAALIPGLGLHYYVKHLQTKIIIQQAAPQPQNVIRVVDTAQMRQQSNINQPQMNAQQYAAYQQSMRSQNQTAYDIQVPDSNQVQIQYKQANTNNKNNNNE